MSQKLLIADDSKTVRTIVKMAFKASGYEISEVGVGNQVVQAVQKLAPDVLVLDYYFEDADGYEVCRALRENPATANVPILMIGGSYKQFNQGLALTSGADHTLVKPFKTDALLQAVEETRQKAKSRPAKSGALPAGGSPPFAALSPSTAAMAPAGGAPAGGLGAGPGRSPVSISPTGSSPAAAPAGVDEQTIRKIVRSEIEQYVANELPQVVQNILSGPIEKKLLYKMISRADERYDEVVRAAVHNQVIVEIEKLLNETV